jgi:N-acetylmuramoyl-L-alanine amidase
MQAALDTGNRAPVVVIDPGHPSEVSSGATVQNGTTEVAVAWAVALRLRYPTRDGV